MYHLLLENSEFVSFDQITWNEVDIVGVAIEEAHNFHSLEEARKAAKTINERKDGKFTLNSTVDVVAVMQEYSVV